MHVGDYLFIFFLALVLFGPKRLPEIARQVGKLMMEFRRASNEFKLQMEDELRTMEQQERQKKLEAAAAQQAQPAPQPSPAITVDAVPEAAEVEPTILPPSQGSPVSTEAPFTRAASHAEALPAEISNDPPAQPESDAAIHHA
jgi:sec-independent protein translocase protein TatB